MNVICHSVIVDGWWLYLEVVGHFNSTCCNRTCLNFLYSEVVGTQRHKVCEGHKWCEGYKDRTQRV